MPRPTPLESNLSQLGRVSGLKSFESDQKGFLKAEKGLPSRIEVGLKRDSASVLPLELKLENNRGERKIEELCFLYTSFGDGKVPKSAIRACFLPLVTADLFLSI